MDDIQCAWVAGILEGEGSFTLGAPGNRTRVKRVRQIQITCGMTDRDTIERLHAVTGVGNLNLERRRDPRRENAKPMYVWSVTKRADVVPLMQRIRPHMSIRRGAKIDELLKYAEDNPMIYNQPVVCGTRRAYRKGCRCSDCRGATAAYARKNRARKKAQDAQD